MSDLDLKAYLRRIGYAGPLEPTLAVLEAIHLAHATHIAFESLDVLLKRPIRLDLAGIQEKLVKGARGGYCFEQNLLLAAALTGLGFDVTPLGARVRHRGDKPLPRTHMLLMVRIEGADYIADVGFGGEGLLLPVPFRTGAEYRHYAWTYRLVEERGDTAPGRREGSVQWLLQSRREPGWGNLYSFTLEPQTLEDYEMANHYTATHPDSPFVRTLIVQLPTPGARHILRDRELTIDRGGGRLERRRIEGDDELIEVLAVTFGLRFAPGTRFDRR
jgi:N-hydroxyarylamine O-acetyltransferase